MELSSTDDVKKVAAQVNAERDAFRKRHADLPPLERIEEMLVDIFGLLYTEFYIRKGE